MKKETHRETPLDRKRRTKPKVVKEWGEDDIFKLISLVEGEKCLWDTADDAYHNKTIRGRAWRNISDNFDLKYSTADLNAKWTNLRIQFRSYVGTAKRKSSQGVIKAPKWRFYNAMRFVWRSEEQQSQQNVCNNSNNISNNVSDDESGSSSLDHVKAATPPLLTQWEDPITLRQQQGGNSEITMPQITETMREMVVAIKECNNINLEPNTAFANYLLSELKTLNRETAAAVRKKVTVFFLQSLEEERTKKINGFGPR